MTQEGTQEESIPFIPLNDEMPDERMEKGFTQFVEEHGFTSKEISAAYNHLMGVDADSEVPAILIEEMQRLERDHFPVNRFAEFSRTLNFVETAVPSFEHFVEELPVSDNEKYMLRSIVKKQRVGELEIFIAGELVKKVRVRGNTGEPHELALVFGSLLKQYYDEAQQIKEKLEFQFTE